MTTYNATYRRPEYYRYTKTLVITRPLQWLQAGWDDIVRSPASSLLIGLGFTMLYLTAYSAAKALPMFSISYLTLLLAASPFLAAIAYFVAGQHEQGVPASLPAAVSKVRNRALSIGLFSLLTALMVAVWLRLSSIVFALYLGALGPDQAQLARAWTAGFEFPAMLVFVGLAGTVLGLTLFAIGAIALPAIADRSDDLIDAVRAGLEALRANPTTMTIWMLLIVSLIAIGLLFALFMPIIFPLLAYATWHSYRDLGAS